MPFTLSSIPGFADLSDAALAHDRNALGLLIAKISSNAAFGMARLEAFGGQYVDGDTVALPVSPIDGYVYSRSELYYLWAPQNTGNPKTNWCSAGPPWTMWYMAYVVDQATGVVSCATGYRGNTDHNDRKMHTTDGVLSVWTIAQRQRSSLSVVSTPYYAPRPHSNFATDAALTEQLLKDMNNSGKYGVINAEVIYMGEFRNGGTVPQPVSPIDGYTYPRPEVLMMTSLRWTMDDNGATPPAAAAPADSKGQLKGFMSSVDAGSGAVAITTTYQPGGNTTMGRVSVWAFCARNSFSKVVGVPGTTVPWDPTLAGNSAYAGVFSSGGAGATAPIVATGPTALVAGQTVKITATGTCKPNPSWPDYPPAGGSFSGGGGLGSAGDNTPMHAAGLPDAFMQLCGAFTDAAGNVILPLSVGAGGTFTVPVGATQLQLGTNDTSGFWSDNTGAFTVTLVFSNPPLAAVANSFSEITDDTFFPGSTLRASTMLQLEENIEEAQLSPEFFGPTTYSNGDTVALPVSAVDGYAYTRAEVLYLWDYVNTTVAEADNARIVFESVAIDDTTGAVAISAYRASSSSDGAFLAHNASIRVLVFAKRNSSPVHPPVATPVPVIGGGISNDEPQGGEITVNGA